MMRFQPLAVLLLVLATTACGGPDTAAQRVVLPFFRLGTSERLVVET